jgi:hypothetical protein
MVARSFAFSYFRPGGQPFTVGQSVIEENIRRICSGKKSKRPPGADPVAVSGQHHRHVLSHVLSSRQLSATTVISASIAEVLRRLKVNQVILLQL